MKLTKLLSIIILGLGLCLSSCGEDDAVDPCESVTCQNGGTCVEGDCDCPTGYAGTNCGSFDSNEVQFLLDNGTTPIELFNGGVPLADLFGKTYQDGLIFYLNTTNGTGLVAAPSDQDFATWTVCPINISGIDYFYIPDLGFVTTDPPSVGEETVQSARIGDGEANTDTILATCASSGIAAGVCRALGDDWFLPSRGELNLMYTNLHANGYGNFRTENSAAFAYWSSTQKTIGETWMHLFSNNIVFPINNLTTANVRAAKAF